MIIRQLFDSETWTYTYLLADPETREAVLIDPVVERVDRDLKLLAELDLELVYALDTHVHADHVTGSGELRRRTGAVSVVSALANVPCVDRPVQHGEEIRFGRYVLEVRATPGHTDSCVTYVVRDGHQTYAFTGDALFVRGTGRTDFQQGDPQKLYRSVHSQIFSLPDDTIVYPGHDYRGHTSTTVGEEKSHNPRLRLGIDENQFTEIMANLNLADPKRMDVAVPANLACGRVAEDHPAAYAGFGQIRPDQITEVGDFRVIDVRSEEEFRGELGRIPGAELVPLPHLQETAEAWSREQPLLMVCRSGRRSERASAMLAAMGFTDVNNLTGGMLAWVEQHPSHAVTLVSPSDEGTAVRPC